MLTEALRGVLAGALRGAAGLLERTANRFVVAEAPEEDWRQAFGRYELSPRAQEIARRMHPPPPPDPAPQPLAGSAAARMAAARRP